MDAALDLLENPLLQPLGMDDNQPCLDLDRSNCQASCLLSAGEKIAQTIYGAPILPISDWHAVSCIVGLYSRRNLTAIIDYYPAGCRMYGRSM